MSTHYDSIRNSLLERIAESLEKLTNRLEKLTEEQSKTNAALTSIDFKEIAKQLDSIQKDAFGIRCNTSNLP